MSEERISTGDIAVGTKDDDAVDERERQQDADAPITAEANEQLEPLLGNDDAGTFRQRWQDVQVKFVDEPRQAVEEADALVAELMQRLAQTFNDERQKLEGQWSRGDDVSTEDLRVGLQRYRSFFERLLTT